MQRSHSVLSKYTVPSHSSANRASTDNKNKTTIFRMIQIILSILVKQEITQRLFLPIHFFLRFTVKLVEGASSGQWCMDAPIGAWTLTIRYQRDFVTRNRWRKQVSVIGLTPNLNPRGSNRCKLRFVWNIRYLIHACCYIVERTRLFEELKGKFVPMLLVMYVCMRVG